MAKQIYIIITSLVLLFVFALPNAQAQRPVENTHKVVKTVSYKNTPIDIPDHLSDKEKAERFAKIMGNRLSLTDTQVMRLTIRRMQYLKKVEAQGASDQLNAEFNAKLYELLTPEQRKVMQRSQSQLAQK